MGDNGHSYDRPYNACVNFDGGGSVSRYYETLDEVREDARQPGQTVAFVNKGYADYRYDYPQRGIDEITRRTTGSVHPRHWDRKCECGHYFADHEGTDGCAKCEDEDTANHLPKEA